MTRKVDFFFDIASPTAYIAWARLPAIAERQGAELEYRPMLLGGLFRTVENVSPVMHEAKRAYMFRDIERCAAMG